MIRVAFRIPVEKAVDFVAAVNELEGKAAPYAINNCNDGVTVFADTMWMALCPEALDAIRTLAAIADPEWPR